MKAGNFFKKSINDREEFKSTNRPTVTNTLSMNSSRKVVDINRKVADNKVSDNNKVSDLNRNVSNQINKMTNSSVSNNSGTVSNANNTINNNKKDDFNGACKMLDKEIIGKVILNFPTVAEDIKESLHNLQLTLESAINYIEDESSVIIKKERNFIISEEYRRIAIKIYEMGQEIDNYTMWMDNEANINLSAQNDDVYNNFNMYEQPQYPQYIQQPQYAQQPQYTQQYKQQPPQYAQQQYAQVQQPQYNQQYEKQQSYTPQNETTYEEPMKKKESRTNFKNPLKIFEDFTGKTPVAFKLKDIVEVVDDWEHLTVRIAEILNRSFRDNINSNIKVPTINVVKRRSQQNILRDAIIDMLGEYKIALNELTVDVISIEK